MKNILERFITNKKVLELLEDKLTITREVFNKDHNLLEYLNDFKKNKLDMILINRKEIIDSYHHSNNWVNLTNNLYCAIYLISNTIIDCNFTYNGKILCNIFINDYNTDITIEGYMSDVLNGRLQLSNPPQNIFKLTGDKFEYNNEFDSKVMVPVIKKCLDSLYKKAYIRNSRREQKIKLSNKEINKQKEIRNNISMKQVQLFADAYINNIIE